MSHHHHGHHHHHGDQSGSETNSQSKIGKAFIWNGAFLIVEIFGAYFTGSVAILANLIHDVGDAVALAVAYILQKFSHRKPDEKYTYGYGRYSIFSSVFTGVVLCVSSVIIVLHATTKFGEHHVPESSGMLILGAFGIIFNTIAMFQLRGSRLQNEKILQWHFVEDIGGWIIVLIGAVFVKAFQWAWIDPLMAIFLASYIAFNVLKHLKESIEILFQQSPSNFPKERFTEEIKKIDHVVDVHDMRVWTLDGQSHVLSMHVVADSASSQKETKQKIRKIGQSFKVAHMTIEIDLSDQGCDL